MNIVDIIIKKRNGEALSQDEIKYFVKAYTKEEIPDYQMSALLMAIYFSKMTREETFELTNAMRYSGETIDLSEIDGIKVDKHSTGGVGDKVTLIVAPIVAACGVPVAKMSGRGLGFTGGTIDKLESIPGFDVSLSPEAFIEQVNDIGIAVMGQTQKVAPADKKIYALRDVTGTVDNLSLISSSIMSKKLASGSDAILLDVKCGNGAFMEEEEDAIRLGEMMCSIGNSAGKRTVAAITSMDEPLGKAIGNSLEVMEAIDVLKGEGPKDIKELAIELAGIMIYLGGKVKTPKEGKILAMQAIESGAAINKLRAFIEAQGGNSDVIEDYSLFEEAKYKEEIISEEEGYITKIDARMIGIASQYTGAGRSKKDEKLDLGAGILLGKKLGCKVSRGDILLTIFSSDRKKLRAATKEIKDTIIIEKHREKEEPKIRAIIGI